MSKYTSEHTKLYDFLDLFRGNMPPNPLAARDVKLSYNTPFSQNYNPHVEH